MLKINVNPDVATRLKTYPAPYKKRLKYLRKLILATAKEIPEIKELEETLKWNEPAYLVKKGSTIRIDWKPKKPDQYAMYFKCTSKLVLTFRSVFGEKFNYEKNRAIVFKLEETVPEKELKQCIAAALQYHSVKELPKLGME